MHIKRNSLWLLLFIVACITYAAFLGFILSIIAYFGAPFTVSLIAIVSLFVIAVISALTSMELFEYTETIP